MQVRKQILIIIIMTAVIINCSCSSKLESGPIPINELFRILKNQPDHVADRTFSSNGVEYHMRIAFKEGRFRIETYPFAHIQSLQDDALLDYKIVIISNPGSTRILVDPQAGIYAEAPAGVFADPLQVERLFKDWSDGKHSKARAEVVGAEDLDGQQVTKIKVTEQGEQYEAMLYIAPAMNNLLMRVDVLSDDKITGSCTISKLLLEVEDEMFQAPDSYNKVDIKTIQSVLMGKRRQR